MNDKQNNDVDALKASIKALVLELQKRGTLFGKLNAIFQASNFDSTNSTENLIKRIEKLERGNNENRLTKFYDLLTIELEKSIKYANKQVYLHAVDNEELHSIFNALKDLDNLNISDDSQKSKFDLFSRDESDPEFKVIYLKSSRKRFEYKEITDKDIKRNVTTNDEELIRLIKQVAYPMDAYDFIAFDFKKNKLIIGADLIDIFKLNETDVAVSQITQQIEKLVNFNLSTWDLRSCVKSFEAEKTGKDSLLNVGLTTADGKFNHFGKTATSGQDLNEHLFYEEGKKASNVESYRLKKLYDLSDSKFEEKIIITLGLKYSDYHKVPAIKVRFAILDNIERLSGLKFAIRKIIEHHS